MTDVTDDELLRLARKVAHWEVAKRVDTEERVVELCDEYWGGECERFITITGQPPELARRAMHAALQVLAGELDVDALKAQLAKRREPTDAAVERYCEMRHGGAWWKYTAPGRAAVCRANARIVLRELLALCDSGDGAT